jgi:hypothetical protein
VISLLKANAKITQRDTIGQEPFDVGREASFGPHQAGQMKLPSPPRPHGVNECMIITAFWREQSEPGFESACGTYAERVIMQGPFRTSARMENPR